MAIETKSEVNSVAYLDFGSPRYRAAYNQSAKYIPDDYPNHDAVNGTYDAYFPLYRITSSPPPVMYLKTPNTLSKITGELAVQEYQLNNKTAQYGAIKEDRERPANTTLESQTVSYNDWSNLPINPGWDVIVDTTLVKLLGNIHTINYIHAFDLDSYTGNPTSPLPKNAYVKYKNNVWRSLTATFSLPPEDPNEITSIWSYVPSRQNVFYAAVYSLNQGKTAFLYEEEDEDRNFNPLNDPEQNLVCWNAAYYPS